MGKLTFALKAALKVPVDGSTISPDNLAGKSLKEIRSLQVWEGNRKVPLEDLFEVEEESAGAQNGLTIELNGDLSKVKCLGAGMRQGTIIANGNVGMFLGKGMEGGSMKVKGNAGSWLGSEMKGGTIEVEGNAGDFVGSAYRGSRRGMRGGMIIIKGNCGVEAGCWMGGGFIEVAGNCGIFPGIHMVGGTILVRGDCEGRVGAEMKGGKIVILGRVPSVLPSFEIEEIRKAVKVGGEKIQGPFYLFTGDLNEEGEGKLFVSVASNPHLKWWENYLEEWV